MPKRVLIIILLVAAIVFTSCHNKVEQKESSTLPSLWLTLTPFQLDSIYNDQDNKVKAEAILLNAQGDTMFQGTLAHIKTRGNTTFREPKKPFGIKFPQKQCFFGLENNRSFVLLANACDESHIRNAIGLDMARVFGIPASRYAYLILYINGYYGGLYQITNKVDVGKNAIDIINLDKMNQLVNAKPIDSFEWFGLGREKQVILRKGVLLDNNPDDITGGYLLDITGSPQQYNKSISGFVSEAKDNVRIKSPQYASAQEVDYIAKRYNEMERAVLSVNGINPVTGKHYSDYIDVESFARYYLLNELLMNWDGGWSSFMMYKNRDTIDPKLYAGPAWDYDRTLNNPKFPKKAGEFENVFYLKDKTGKTGVAYSGGLLHYLCLHEDFQQAVRDCYLNEISSACHEYMATRPFDSLITILSHEVEQDEQKYKTRLSDNYDTAINKMLELLQKRIAFFDWYYASTEEERVMVLYLSEEGYSREFFYPIGEPIKAPEISKVQYNHDPVYELYYAGTDSIVPDGTVFQTPQKLELRKREPTKKEVQIRQVKKKLRKIGIDF